MEVLKYHEIEARNRGKKEKRKKKQIWCFIIESDNKYLLSSVTVWTTNGKLMPNLYKWSYWNITIKNQQFTLIVVSHWPIFWQVFLNEKFINSWPKSDTKYLLSFVSVGKFHGLRHCQIYLYDYYWNNALDDHKKNILFGSS